MNRNEAIEAEVVEAQVEADLNRLTPQEVEGGYRSLCAGMLLRTAQEICQTAKFTSEAMARRQAARRWLFRKTGVITLSEACQACDLQARDFRDRLVESAENLARHTKNIAANKKNRFVFGRRLDAERTDDSQAGPDHP